MCGIFGAVHLAGAFSAREYAKFVALTDMVAYRGPSASGNRAFLVQQSSRESRERFNVFFGHRRLSILDTSDAANQPFTRDGEIWITFNGEIFNFIELRKDLEREGHVFTTTSDTEVLLRIYESHGAEAFHMLNGMWAFAVLDAPKRKVILSRDRFSIKPLYLLHSGNTLYFASEIKQLRPLAPTTRLNERVMCTFLDQGLSDCSDETFFEGIRQLKPKHSLTIDLESGTVREHQYWEHTVDEDVHRLKPDDAIAAFRELFTDSVKIRLRSDVEVGAAISGGLDSSAIAVIAEGLQPGFRTYSAVSKDARFSEEPYVDLLCRDKKLTNKKVLLEPTAALGLVQEVTDHHDEPLGGFSIVAHYQLMRAIQQQTGAVVVMSGQGGDETLMGYLRFFFFTVRDLLRRGRIIRAGSELLFSFLNGTCVRQFSYAKSRRYLRPSSRGTRSFVRLQDRRKAIWQCDDLRLRQIEDIDRFSVPALTHYEDRNSMAHSLEIRVPFLDHRLVNFVLNLPAELKIRRGWTKYVLRKAMWDLPDRIRWRKDKQGFLTPEKDWLRNGFSGIIEKAFQRSLLGEMGVIDDARFLEQYALFRSGDWTIPHSSITRGWMAELWARSVFQ